MPPTLDKCLYVCQRLSWFEILPFLPCRCLLCFVFVISLGSGRANFLLIFSTYRTHVVWFVVIIVVVAAAAAVVVYSSSSLLLVSVAVVCRCFGGNAKSCIANIVLAIAFVSPSATLRLSSAINWQ